MNKILKASLLFFALQVGIAIMAAHFFLTVGYYMEMLDVPLLILKSFAVSALVMLLVASYILIIWTFNTASKVNLTNLTTCSLAGLISTIIVGFWFSPVNTFKDPGFWLCVIFIFWSLYTALTWQKEASKKERFLNVIYALPLGLNLVVYVVYFAVKQSRKILSVARFILAMIRELKTERA